MDSPNQALDLLNDKMRELELYQQKSRVSPYEDKEGLAFEMKNRLTDIAVERQLNLERQLQLRLREIPEFEGDNLKAQVKLLILKALGVVLIDQEILSVSRMKSWDEAKGLRDVLVTFSYKNIRRAVYEIRHSMRYGRNLIVDELTPHNVGIFKEAEKIYGFERVFTNDGRVILEADDGVYYVLNTFARLHELARRDRPKPSSE